MYGQGIFFKFLEIILFVVQLGSSINLQSGLFVCICEQFWSFLSFFPIFDLTL